MINSTKVNSKKQKQKKSKNNIPTISRTKLLNELTSGKFICSYHSTNIRDVVYNARKTGLPIETLTCLEEECTMKERKHKAYYYEWALEQRR